MNGRWNRRQFAVLAATPLCGVWSEVEAAEEPLLVDTHLHCFGGKDAKFPYHQRAPYRPSEPATPQHLLKCMDGAGVRNAIVVHPEPYQDDHRYLEHCLRVGGKRLKGTVLFFADRPGWREKMSALVERRRDQIIAARVHAYAPGRLPPFGKPELKALWRHASELGLALQLHFEPRYAPGFESLIREFPKTTVIIDHLGRPFQGTPREHRVVVDWAKYPNTIMKVSSLPSPRNYPHRQIKPIIKQLTEAFGADRMVYGGGFSASATPEAYRAAFARARTLLDHLPKNEQDKILGRTAQRFFRFA